MNGGLFADDIGCPAFSRTSRAYLMRAGELDWKTINPDIFGSMIQAVADDDERGELGMHYTSVPNIQKVLDPLFLDDLREQLEAAGTNKRMLFNLRQRLSRIRVFDPACGSGNFLVIAYIRMREIEDEIMRRRGEALDRSAIRLTQFYGIEIKSFAAEIARLSLLIAEFQCDVRFIGQTEARALVLPLHATGNIILRPRVSETSQTAYLKLMEVLRWMRMRRRSRGRGDVGYRSGRGSGPGSAHDIRSQAGRCASAPSGRAAGDRGARSGGDGGGLERLAGCISRCRGGEP